MAGLIVTGAGGKLGRLMRAAWAPGPVWLHRAGWDMLVNPVPDGLPQGATVLHLAGVTRGNPANLQVNVDLVAPLLHMCRKIGARRLIFMSSAAVYRPGALARESDPLAPPGPYGMSKAQAESLIRAQADVPFTILRPGNIAGADALLGPRGVGEITLDPVPGQPRGPLRSWIGARLLTDILGALCVRMELPPILNLAQPGPLPMADLLDAGGLPWQFGPTPAPVPVATQDTAQLQLLLPVPPANAANLAKEAAWAREVLT